MGVVMPARLSALACRKFIAVALGALTLVTAGDGRASPREGMQVEIAVPIVEVSREQIDQLGLAIDVLNELNEVRTDPQRYAAELRSRPRLRGIGSSDFNEALTFLDAQRPLPPLSYSPPLSDIALFHARDIGTQGLTSHTGSRGATMGGRFRARGLTPNMTAEELSFGQRSGADVILSLIVDAGVPGKPHRADLFNPVFIFVGAGCAPHKGMGQVCVINLSNDFMRPPPSISFAPTPENAGLFNCPAGQAPADADAIRGGLLSAPFGSLPRDHLEAVATANEVAQRHLEVELGLNFDAYRSMGSAPWTPQAANGSTRPRLCVPADIVRAAIPNGGTTAQLDDAVAVFGLRAVTDANSMDDVVDQALTASLAYEPGLLYEPDIEIDWMDGQTFSDFTADDLTCDSPLGPMAPLFGAAAGAQAGSDQGRPQPDVNDIYAGYSYSNSFGFTSIQAGINNLFDAPPPAVINGILANSDAGNYDYLGRYFYMGLCSGF